MDISSAVIQTSKLQVHGVPVAFVTDKKERTRQIVFFAVLDKIRDGETAKWRRGTE